ncbi:MAG: hypothetical protein HUJ54_07070 [Erysipelotrichaceae bacterium]|nr:hypothetical protein [Erysipelotrichaceae bacterium]
MMIVTAWTAALLAWLYLLSVLKRANRLYGLFLTGSLGAFLLFAGPLFQPVRSVIASAAALMESAAGDLTGLYHTDYAASVIKLREASGSVGSVYLQESLTSFFLIFTIACLIFYPKYTVSAKVILTMGCLLLFTGCAAVFQILVALVHAFAGQSNCAGLLIYALTIVHYMCLSSIVYIIFLKGRGNSADRLQEKRL